MMLSYSHRDMPLCDVVENAIRSGVPDISILRDTEMQPGTRVLAGVHGMIKTCSVAIFFLTKNGVESSWVRTEWSCAEHHKVLRIPVVEECVYKKAKERFSGLSELKCIFLKIEDYAKTIPELVQAIKKTKAATGSKI